MLKLISLLVILSITACSTTAKAPEECAGTIRKINPETVSVAALSCNQGVA